MLDDFGQLSAYICVLNTFMMFGGLGVLNAVLTYDIFDYDGLSGSNPVTSKGTSVLAQSPPGW